MWKPIILVAAMLIGGFSPALAQETKSEAKPAAEAAKPAAEAAKPAQPIIWRTTCICTDGSPTVTAKIQITEGNLPKIKEFFDKKHWDNGKEVWFYGACADPKLCTPRKTDWGDVATLPVNGPLRVTISARRNLPSPGNETPGRVFELDGWVLQKP